MDELDTQINERGGCPVRVCGSSTTYKGRVAASRASLSLLLDLPTEERRRCLVVFVATPVCVRCEMAKEVRLGLAYPVGTELQIRRLAKQILELRLLRRWTRKAGRDEAGHPTKRSVSTLVQRISYDADLGHDKSRVECAVDAQPISTSAQNSLGVINGSEQDPLLDLTCRGTKS